MYPIQTSLELRLNNVVFVFELETLIGLCSNIQVAKRLLNTASYFKRLGTLGFWGQLVCTLVAAVILSFSIAITGRITSPFTFYSTAGGIAAAFISVFWSFGYLRLSEKLRKTANDPSKVTPQIFLKLLFEIDYSMLDSHPINMQK